MRLATWNCCGKFDDNLRHLLNLGVDCRGCLRRQAPTSWPITRDRRRVTGVGRRVWTESCKELVVVAAKPWTIAVNEAAGSSPAGSLPVRVTGPWSFTLVGLWPVVSPGTPSYVAQIDRAVDWIERHATQEPTVLAGDFNAPIASSQAHYDRVEDRLNGLGLQDAYRTSRGLLPGERPVEATYYQHRRANRRFHIDHVFRPATWPHSVKLLSAITPAGSPPVAAITHRSSSI